MGICMKNSVHSVSQSRAQQNPPVDIRSNLVVNGLNLRVNPIINRSVEQVDSPLQVPSIQQIDISEPQPQGDLSYEFQQEKQSSSEDDNEIIKQIERLEIINRARSSGVKQTNSDDSTCGICYEKYQIFSKWPMQICHNQHIICDQCIKDFQKLFKNQPFPCPFCRLLVFQHQVKPSKQKFKSLKKLSHSSQKNSQEIEFYIFAFEHQLYEIAGAYKQKRTKDIKKLQHLQFQNKLIQSFLYFSYFKNIIFLQLQHNRINQCLFLLPLSSTLKILNLSHNQIQSLDWMSEFKYLQILACEYNKIRQITFYETIQALKQLYIMGNPINDKDTIQNFQQTIFQNMKLLSIQSQNSQIQIFYLSEFEQIQRNKETKAENEKQPASDQRMQTIFDKIFPSLSAFIIPSLQQKGRQVKIIPKLCYNESLLNFIDEENISNHLHDCYFYGNLFEFKPDGKNPHYREYRFLNNKLLKLSSNFTTLNSKHWIPHIGKQTLKLRLRQKNNNIMVGICTRNIKYSASVYSSEFVGITFWGNIYNKSESIPINCDLRINDGSVIAMILDFDKGEISWYIDKRRIGKLTKQKYFLKTKQLYFLYGVRDSEVQVEFII